MQPSRCLGLHRRVHRRDWPALVRALLVTCEPLVANLPRLSDAAPEGCHAALLGALGHQLRHLRCDWLNSLVMPVASPVEQAAVALLGDHIVHFLALLSLERHLVELVGVVGRRALR